MKTTKFLFILLLPMLFAQGVKGQYMPLVDTTNQWNLLVTFYPCHPPGIMKSTLKLSVSSSDTAINSTVYKKVLTSSGFYYSTDSIFGYIREDALTKRVYFLSNDFFNPDTERLLYDFSINTGDTVEVFSYLFCQNVANTFVVTSTDSIMLLNNEKRKVWNLTSLDPLNFPNHIYPTDKWVEGIGSINGLVFSGCYDDPTTNSFISELLCFYTNDYHLYIHQQYDTCFYEYSSNINEVFREDLLIYPNPAQEVLNIVLNDFYHKNNTIEILDAYGKIIYENMCSDNQCVIDISHIVAGVYFVRIRSNQKNLIRKFIKN